MTFFVPQRKVLNVRAIFPDLKRGSWDGGASPGRRDSPLFGALIPCRPNLVTWSTRPIKVGGVLASGYPWRVLEGSVQWGVGEGLALLFIATPRPEPRLLSSHGLYSMCHLEINHMTPRGISSFV